MNYIVQMLSPGEMTDLSDRAWQKQHICVARGNHAPFHGTLSCSPLSVDTNGPILIGVSLSEPHTSESNGVYIYCPHTVCGCIKLQSKQTYRIRMTDNK